MGQTLELTLGELGLEENFAVSRVLSGVDVSLIDSPRGVTAPTVKVLRETHHQLARLLAQGIKQVEVSAITGFSQSRISILKQDPAFMELIEHYREIKDSAFADVNGQLASLSVDVLSELRDRLHDTPEGFRTRELMDFLSTLLDRTGHGPTSKTENRTVFVTGEDLVKLKQMAKESQCGHVTTELIENACRATEESVPEGDPAEVGEAIGNGARLQASETSRGESEGENV